jgi:hypothetical protein
MYASANVTQQPFVLAFHAACPSLVVGSKIRILMKFVCISTTLTPAFAAGLERSGKPVRQHPLVMCSSHEAQR